MNKLGILKNVAYAAKKGGGAIAVLKDISNLDVGAIALFANDTLLPDIVATPPADITTPLLDAKSILIAIGRKDGNTLLVNIPRKQIKNLEKINYKAPVKPVFTISNLGLTDASKGEIGLGITDSTYTSKYIVRRNIQAFYKSANVSVTVAIDKLIAQLNADTMLKVVASKTGVTPNFSIVISPVEEDTTIEITKQELLEDAIIAVTTPMVHSVNKGEDILQLEKDYSVYEGNSNSIDYNDLWFKKTFDTDVAVNYDVISIMYDGIHNTATSNYIASVNTFMIALPTGGAIATVLSAIFDYVLGTKQVAIESGTDTGAANDGV